MKLLYHGLRSRAYELRHRRREGFDDKHLESKCIIHEIKFLFQMLTDIEKKRYIKQTMA